MTTRKYSSRAQQTTLSSGITSGDTSMTVGSGANLMGGKTPAVGETYTVVIDPDTASEEIVDISNYASGNTLTIARGIDGSTGVAHSAGAVVRHMVIGRDLQDANNHTENTTTAHGVTGAVVGTTNTQTLTNKTLTTNTTLTSPTITTPSISAPNITGTATAVNLTASGTVTSALFSGPLTGAVTGNVTGNVTGTVTGSASLNLLKSGDTMSGAIAMGANKITGLGTPTANTTDAANTAYVDAAITTAVTNVIASAPALLDTLDELAAALGDDANFATTVTTNLALKAPLASPALTGVPTAPTATAATNTTQIATTAFVQSVTTAPSNLTGVITSVGPATSIASQTGTGTKFVVDTSPTLITPVLGVATATSINGTTIPSSVTLVKTSDTLANLSSTTSAQLAGVISDETGTGALVFGSSPTLSPAAAANIGLTVKGAASQTANLMEFQNSSGTAMTFFNSSGGLTATEGIISTLYSGGKMTTGTLGYLNSTTFNAAVSPIVVRGAASQTANLQEWQNSAGTVLAKVTAAGTIVGTSTYTAKTAAYTFASGDEGNLFSMNNAATQQFNIPTDATFNFAVGTEINVFWITGAGQPTIGAVTPGTTTVISTGATSATPKLRVANSGATCKKLAANSWIIFGDLA